MHNSLKKLLCFVLPIAVVLLTKVYTYYNEVNHFTSAVLYKSVVLDAGHGGIDSGASYENVYEKDINLSLLLHLKGLLEQNSFNVITTRETDMSLDRLNTSSHSRHSRDLIQRERIISNSNCEFFISLHVNSFSSSSVSGPRVYYKGNCQVSKKLASCIQNSLNTISFEQYTPRTSTEAPGRYYLLGETTKAGVLIEVGFISNQTDRLLLINEEYQKYLAGKIYAGIQKFYELD